MALFTQRRGTHVLGSSGHLALELIRPERLSQLFPGGSDELRVADDLLYVGLGGVAAHVFFLKHLWQGCALVYARDDVLEDLLLTLAQRGAAPASEQPLPKGSLLAHIDFSPAPSLLASHKLSMILPGFKLGASSE